MDRGSLKSKEEILNGRRSITYPLPGLTWEMKGPMAFWRDIRTAKVLRKDPSEAKIRTSLSLLRIYSEPLFVARTAWSRSLNSIAVETVPKLARPSRHGRGKRFPFLKMRSAQSQHDFGIDFVIPSQIGIRFP